MPANPRPRPGLTLRGVLLLVALVDLLLLAATGSLEYWYQTGQSFEQLPWVKWPLILVNLGREQTLGAWWPAAVMAGAGVLMLTNAGLLRTDGAAGRRVVVQLLGGLALLGLSLDELAAVHERVFASNAQPTAAAFDSPAPWLVPLLPLGVLGLLAVRRARGPVVSRCQVAAWCGIACLFTVPLQKEIETSRYAPGQRPPSLLLVEEGTELLGTWLLLAASALLLRVITQDDSVAPRLRQRLSQRWWLLFNLGAVVSVLATVAARSRYGDYAGDPQSGLPQWWFGSLAAAVLAATAFRSRRLAPRSEARPATALSVIGWAAVLLSVGFGIDAFTWATLADPSLDRVLRICLATVLGLAGLWLSLTWRLAGLGAVACGIVVALGHAAASGWEIGACWAAAAVIQDAAVLREVQSPAPRPTRPPRVAPAGRQRSTNKRREKAASRRR